MTTTSTVSVWENEKQTVIDVISMTRYRVTFEADEATISGPGLELEVELDWEFYPKEDLEACATMLVLQLEGGLVL